MFDLWRDTAAIFFDVKQEINESDEIFGSISWVLRNNHLLLTDCFFVVTSFGWW